MFTTVFSKLQTLLQPTTALQWQTEGAKPTVLPGTMLEMPKNLKWDSMGDGSRTSRGALVLHIYTDAPIDPDEPIQNETVAEHEQLVDTIVTELEGLDVLDPQNRLIASGFEMVETYQYPASRGMLKTSITLDVEWTKYAGVKKRTKVTPLFNYE